MFWVFSGPRLGFGRRDLLLFFGVFARLHNSRQKEPAEAAAALEASAKSRGDTPLHKAASHGHAECVDLLLKAGAEKARPRRSQGGFGRDRGNKFRFHPMAFVDMSCYLLSSSFHGHLCASMALSKMLWIRLSSSAYESSSFHGLLCTAVSRMDVFRQPHAPIYAVDCLGTRLESFFPENATQPKESSHSNLQPSCEPSCFSHFTTCRTNSKVLPFVASPVHYFAFVPMRGSQVCDNRIPNSLPTHPTLPSPLLGALSPLPSLSLPGRNGHDGPGAPEGLCSALGAMLSFQILYVRSLWSASDLPKTYKKRGRQSMFWVFSGPRLGFGRRDLLLFFGVFARLHNSRQKEPAEAAAALEASAKSRGDTPLHWAALLGHAECVDLLLNAGAEKARPRRSQGGFPSGGSTGVKVSRARRA